MDNDTETKPLNYFENHGISPDFYQDYKIPCYLDELLPQNKEAKILDVGPGLGQFLLALKQRGYSDLLGIETFSPAVDYCREKGLNVIGSDGSWDELISLDKKYDFITLSHVLEHLPKEKIISSLKKLRSILAEGGKLVVMVPNGQATTGCYWAYEDFTHSTLFTAGSLIYVLKEAGFRNISIVDPYAIAGASYLKKLIRSFFWVCYDWKEQFYSKMLDASFHRPSPRVYSFEVKAIAGR